MTPYTSAAKKLLDNDYDLLSDTIKVAIVSSAYTVNAAHDFFDDITSEVSGTGYTTGGSTLANKSTSSANPSVFDSDDITLSSSGSGFSNGRTLIIYKSTGTAATSPLVCSYAAAANFGNVAGDLTIAWAATGIARLTVSSS